MVETRVERPKVPAALLTCRPEPAAPPAGYTQSDVAMLIGDLVVAGADCRAKVDALRRLLGGGGGGRVDDDGGKSGYEAYMLVCLKNTRECREVYDPTLFHTYEDCARRARELARDPRGVASVAGFAGMPFRYSVHCRPVGMKRRPA